MRRRPFGMGNTERFWSKVMRTRDGCWTWTDTPNKLSGYSGFELEGKTFLAYRLAVLMSGREIPEDKEVDHLCRNKMCVRPSHLEVVTHAENMRRRHVLRTTCPAGHKYDSTFPDKNGKRYRRCSVCASEASRRSYFKRRGRVAA